MFRKILSSFLVFLFGIVFFLALVTTGLRVTILNPNFVLRTIRSAHLYEQIIPQALSIVFNQMDKEAGVKLPITQDKIAAMLATAAPPEWIEAHAGPLIQEGIYYLNGNRATLEATIDLKDVKIRLRAALATKRSLAPYRELVYQLPDQFNLTDTIKQNQKIFDQARDYVALFKKIQVGLVAASAILGILIILINLGHYDELARRVASSLLGTAIPLLALGGLGYWYAPRLFGQLQQNDLSLALLPLATTLAHQAFWRMVLWGGGLAAASVILFILAKIYETTKHHT